MRSRISWDSFFLPTRSFTLEIRLQYLLKPARCQRTTVSGVTMMRELFQADQNRRAETQNSLSRGLSLGLGCLRFSTVSCWQSAKFSKSSVRCERKQRASSPYHSRKKEEAEHREQSYQIGGLRKVCKLLISQLARILANDRLAQLWSRATSRRKRTPQRDPTARAH